MKKFFALIILFLAGCSSNNQISAENGATVTPLNPEEYKLLKVAGVDNSLAFKVDTKSLPAAKSLEFWIDHYKKGELVKEMVSNLGTNVEEDNTGTNLYFSEINAGEDSIWVLSALSKEKNGESLASNSGPVELDSIINFISPLNDGNIKMNEVKDIGVLISDEEGTFNENVEDAIQQNEDVFVLRVLISDSSEFSHLKPSE